MKSAPTRRTSPSRTCKHVEKFGGTPYIPFKSNTVAFLPGPSAPAIEAPAWERMFHLFAYQQDTFLAHYHKRSNVETTFCMIKAKFGTPCGASPRSVRSMRFCAR